VRSIPNWQGVQLSKHSWPRALATGDLDNGVTTFCQGLARAPGRGRGGLLATIHRPAHGLFIGSPMNFARGLRYTGKATG